MVLAFVDDPCLNRLLRWGIQKCDLLLLFPLHLLTGIISISLFFNLTIDPYI